MKQGQGAFESHKISGVDKGPHKITVKGKYQDMDRTRCIDPEAIVKEIFHRERLKASNPNAKTDLNMKS